MIKLQKTCASFVTRKFCSLEDVTSPKQLLVLERINFTVLKIRLLVKECHETSKSTSRKRNENLVNQQKPQKYATTLYNQAPNQIQEAQNYSDANLKLKSTYLTKNQHDLYIQLKKYPWDGVIGWKTHHQYPPQVSQLLTPIFSISFVAPSPAKTISVMFIQQPRHTLRF